jgi:hypothetical protein
MKQTLLLLSLFLVVQLTAQQELNYYLPNMDYDPSVPTPEEILGFQIGEWHLTHDQVVFYLKILAEKSDRIQLTEYARSYEDRPLIYLTITSPQNQQRLETIKKDHRSLWDPSQKPEVTPSEQPVVIYQGFSIHGNEASGGNAAPLVAYYLAAGQGKEVTELLNQAVILLDPCYNPDGFQRFSTWVNMHKSSNLVTDSQSREFSEAWPRGRTNHYWFDLNRDWLPVQHPESQGRIAVFHDWKPNILTDHHEMGTNATFFFQPGVPQRTNPLTPGQNQELTEQIGNYHAKALDRIGSLYYTKESFDDFYYGKGSTYPDINGSIGILFEQASARGHLQESVNGPLSFAFAIRNQVTTALSTQEAGLEMRQELLTYQSRFFREALKEAKDDEQKAFVFEAPDDPYRIHAFLTLLDRHQIEVYLSAKDIKTDRQVFPKASSYIIPLEQTQYRFIKALFETRTSFKDSIFYDVSSWTLPLAFDLPYASLQRSNYSASLLGERVKPDEVLRSNSSLKQSNYGYLIRWDGYLAPNTLYRLQGKNLRVKVATQKFSTPDGRLFEEGTLFIPLQNQKSTPDEIYQMLQEEQETNQVSVYPLTTGLTPTGIDLGSPGFESLKQPKVAMIVGGGVSSYEAGEVWHLLDQRYDIPLSMLEMGSVSRSSLDQYNVIILSDGNYSGLESGGITQLKNWVQEGGQLIAIRGGASWAASNNFAGIRFKNGNGNSKKQARPYAKLSSDRGAQVIGGAIVRAELDLSHPLLYGYRETELAVFRRGTLVFEEPSNPYAAPLRYAKDPLLSGYISKENQKKISEGVGIVACGNGKGRVICLADNPNFRAFWYGTNRIMANALFFGQVIERRSLENGTR